MGRDKSFSYPVIPRAPFFFSLSPASLRQKKEASAEERELYRYAYL